MPINDMETMREKGYLLFEATLPREQKSLTKKNETSIHRETYFKDGKEDKVLKMSYESLVPDGPQARIHFRTSQLFESIKSF